MAERGSIIIGCSGYSFPQWRGPFYPPDIERASMLEWYAARFGVLELASTFYRLPSASALAHMVRRTEGQLMLSARLHGSVWPGDELDVALLDQFVEGLAPAVEAGVLLAVLAVLPRTIGPTRQAARQLNRLGDRLGDLRLVVEYRHGGWAGPEVLSWMRRRSMALCCPDLPRLPGLFPPVVQLTAAPGYVRFHGRHPDGWSHDAGPTERGAYAYGEADLRPWCEPLRRLASSGQVVAAVFNNRRDGHAPRDATRLQELLGGRAEWP